jgi:hypothetical protein
VLVSGPSHGTLTLNANGLFSYTPAAGYVGADTFTYRASDGTSASNAAMVTLTVQAGPTVVGVRVNDGSAQRSLVTSRAVTFSNLVALPADPAAAFRLTRLGPGGPTGDVTLAVDLSGSTAAQTVARLTFGGPLTEFGSLSDGNYHLTVLGSQVNSSGVALDGDGDGVPGGDNVSTLYRLFGDVNGDRSVDGLDFFQLRSTFNQASADPGFLAYLDFNGDGVVDGLDFFQFRTRFNTTLP